MDVTAKFYFFARTPRILHEYAFLTEEGVYMFEIMLITSND